MYDQNMIDSNISFLLNNSEYKKYYYQKAVALGAVEAYKLYENLYTKPDQYNYSDFSHVLNVIKHFLKTNFLLILGFIGY